jgi:hypothetical protein
MSLLLERYEQMAELDRARAARPRSAPLRPFWLWLAEADQWAAADVRAREWKHRGWVASVPTDRIDGPRSGLDQVRSRLGLRPGCAEAPGRGDAPPSPVRGPTWSGARTPGGTRAVALP